MAQIKQVTIDPDYSIRPILAAVIIQAMRDAHHSNDCADERRHARQWLTGEGLAWLSVAGLELDRRQMRQWIAQGCKLRRRGARRLGR
jgi:hypothetical protein